VTAAKSAIVGPSRSVVIAIARVGGKWGGICRGVASKSAKVRKTEAIRRLGVDIAKWL